MTTINERDKNVFLDSMLKEGEEYEFKVWAALMASNKELAAYGGLGAFGMAGSGMAGAAGALSNIFCYIGLTENSLNIVTLEKFERDRVDAKVAIPIKDIDKIRTRRSIIPKRRMIYIKIKSNENKKKQKKLKISLMSGPVFTDIKNQKENAKIFTEFAKKFGEKS